MHYPLFKNDREKIRLYTSSTGKTWVAVYYKNNGNYDMRGQLLDVDGAELLRADVTT